MQTKFRFVTIAAVAGVLLAGCSAPNGGSQSGPEQSGGAQSTAEALSPLDVNACLLLETETANTASAEALAEKGLDRGTKEVGVATAVAYLDDPEGGVASLIGQRCNLIMGVGEAAHAEIIAGAAERPETYFVLIDGEEVEGASNIGVASFDGGSVSFLAGYAAAAMTPTGLTGTVLEDGDTSRYHSAHGFTKGIERYNEVRGKAILNIGWGPGSPTVEAGADANTVRLFARSLLREDAGLLFPLLDTGASGVLEAAQENGQVWVIWYGTDGVLAEPDFADEIFTSVVYNYEDAVLSTITGFVNGTLRTAPYVGDLANGGTRLADWRDYAAVITPELQAELDTLESDLISGRIIVEEVAHVGGPDETGDDE